MKEINLNKGYVAIVDDDMLEELSKSHWYVEQRSPTRLYARCSLWIEGKAIRHRMHRLVMNADKSLCIDHINGNGLDNRRENLRVCTSQQNVRNSKKYQKETASIYKGVTWHKRGNKWMAQIEADKKHIYLGLFSEEKEAAIAYNEAATILHGEFAGLNII